MEKEVIKKLEELSQKDLELRENLMSFMEQNLDSLPIEGKVILAGFSRSLELIRSFELLVKHNQFLTAIAFIRLHLDTSLRMNLFFFVGDSQKFAQFFLGGNKLTDYSDSKVKKGKLTDAFLIKLMQRQFPEEKHKKHLKEVYRIASGYVHFSGFHYDFIKEINPKNPQEETISVGTHSIPFDKQLNFIDHMINISSLNISVFDSLKNWLNRKKEKVKKKVKKAEKS